jgi:hypothetical protein
VLLQAGERSVRFYPRYDTEPSAIDEALAILRLAIEDLWADAPRATWRPPSKIRVGTLAIPLDTVEMVDVTRPIRDALKQQILEVEQERYGPAARTRRCAAIGAAAAAAVSARDAGSDDCEPGAIGVVLRDRVSGRIVGYALGSALENHDEEGVSSDPRFGENDAFYLQAMAMLPTVQNAGSSNSICSTRCASALIAAGYLFSRR